MQTSILLVILLVVYLPIIGLLSLWFYKDATNGATFSQTQQTLISIGDATDSTGGLWMYYDMSSEDWNC